MIEICPESWDSDRMLDPIKHTAAQAVTGMNSGGQDRPIGNPLVAGSCPARPTTQNTRTSLGFLAASAMSSMPIAALHSAVVRSASARFGPAAEVVAIPTELG
jgi:hypothetical protein